MEHSNAFALPLWSEIASEFGPHMGIGDYRSTRLYDYQPRNLTWETGKEYWQGLTSSWDSRPRCNSSRTRQTSCDGSSPNGLVSPDGFGKALRELHNNFHPMNKDRVVTIFAWNEWSEGAAMEQSVEFGTQFLEQLLQN